jgi:hypothetical protein
VTSLDVASAADEYINTVSNRVEHSLAYPVRVRYESYHRPPRKIEKCGGDKKIIGTIKATLDFL